MRHQLKEKRQVAPGDPLFVQRQDERTRRRVQQEVGILDALGNALVGQQIADRVIFQEVRKLVGGDVGVDRHERYPD